jgi:hypothetical protein
MPNWFPALAPTYSQSFLAKITAGFVFFFVVSAFLASSHGFSSVVFFLIQTQDVSAVAPPID